MKKNLIFSVTVVCILFLSSLTVNAQQKISKKHTKVDWNQSCEECHQTKTPKVVSKWKFSKHGDANVGCFICHGDGEEEFYSKPKSDRCITCHSSQDVDFKRIKVTSCFFCHVGHSLKFHK